VADEKLIAHLLRRTTFGPAPGQVQRLAHFTTSDNKVDRPPLLWRYYRLLAEHATGSFRDLVSSVTVDPAMLIYLDGDGSTGDAPNENYGRELMELFTLGRGDYEQTDVVAGARALSGWSVDGIPRQKPRASMSPCLLLLNSGILGESAGAHRWAPIS